MSTLEALRAACPRVRSNVSLAQRTTLRVGGPADYFAEVENVNELVELRRASQKHALPVYFLGAGSNLLIADAGIRGLVLQLVGDFKKWVFKGTDVTCGAGVLMPTLARQAAERGLAGIEALVGVPGTVGGGLVMNAGTREGWIGNVATSIEALDEQGRIVAVDRRAWKFNYRQSGLAEFWLTAATLTLKPDDAASVKKRLEALLEYRTRTQPLTTSNCGSVFKNPPNQAAAQLIDRAGLKGFAVGHARVSDRHANFIVNEGGATAAEIRQLIQAIQDTVQVKFGVRLEPEVKGMGEWKG